VIFDHSDGRANCPGVTDRNKSIQVSDTDSVSKYTGWHLPLSAHCLAITMRWIVTRTFADGAELHIAVELLCRVIFYEAIATVDLHALIWRSAPQPHWRTASP